MIRDEKRKSCGPKTETGTWEGDMDREREGGTHPADAARTPQPPLAPHQQAAVSISAKSRCYGSLYIRMFRVRARLAKAVGLCSTTEADVPRRD